MKVILAFFCIFLLNPYSFAETTLFFKKQQCPVGYMCLILHTPIQSGSLDETYNIIAYTKVILSDGDKSYDRNEIIIPAGETILLNESMELREVEITFVEISYHPDNHHEDDPPQLLQECKVSYKYPFGAHRVDIYLRNKSYHCHIIS